MTTPSFYDNVNSSEIDVQGVLENPYVSTSESDELDELNDTKV